MEDTPHIVVRTFETLILFPLDLCVLVAGVIFLIEKAWFFGVFLLFMFLLFGIVGQALPHRKGRTPVNSTHKMSESALARSPMKRVGVLGKALIRLVFWLVLYLVPLLIIVADRGTGYCQTFSVRCSCSRSFHSLSVSCGRGLWKNCTGTQAKPNSRCDDGRSKGMRRCRQACQGAIGICSQTR